MKAIGLILCAFLCVTSRPACAQEQYPVTVLVRTSLGDIRVGLETERAPISAANFLKYVDDGLYDGGSFFRTVHADNQPWDSIRIAVIQGGANSEYRDQFFEPIPLERTEQTGLLHVDGAISMARGGPDTATHSFFFCIGDQPELDFGGMRNPDGQGFASFGAVLSGMEVVRSIQMQPADGQTLNQAVEIISISREE